jgi:hypothetical protein
VRPPAQDSVEVSQLTPHTERKRRHNAALAEEIFGKARKPGPHPPARGGRGRGSGVPSLASRVGVTKVRTSICFFNQYEAYYTISLPFFPVLSPLTFTKSSSFSNPRKPTNPFHATNNQAASQNKHLFPRAAPGNTRYEKRAVSASRLENITDSLRASNSNSQDISFRSSTTTPGNGISIRGTASGPFVVVARNFAAGTTVADIESTMTPVGGDITSCRITRDVPNVVAEIAFADKAGADTVIANFDKLRVRKPPSSLPISPSLTTHTGRRSHPRTLLQEQHSPLPQRHNTHARRHRRLHFPISALVRPLPPELHLRPRSSRLLPPRP